MFISGMGQRRKELGWLAIGWGIGFILMVFYLGTKIPYTEVVIVSLINMTPIAIIYFIFQLKRKTMVKKQPQVERESKSFEHVEHQQSLHHSEQLSVLGELAAGIAHEIRNPLTSLKGFIQIVEAECAQTKKYTSIMSSEVERINEIVNEMLFLSKPKAVKFEQKKLQPIIDMVVTLTSTQAILYNIEIVVDYAEDVKEIEIKCEENKLKQVFINLIKNGIEAMSKEGKITIQVRSYSNEIAIHVIDEGIGISKENLQNLGKRFFSTKEKGTGLGLMMCQKIIEEHDGQVFIHSEEGKGTDVEIRLPTSSDVKNSTHEPAREVQPFPK